MLKLQGQWLLVGTILLAGCGSNDAPQAPTPATAPQSPAATVTAADPGAPEPPRPQPTIVRRRSGPTTSSPGERVRVGKGPTHATLVAWLEELRTQGLPANVEQLTTWSAARSPVATSDHPWRRALALVTTTQAPTEPGAVLELLDEGRASPPATWVVDLGAGIQDRARLGLPDPAAVTAVVERLLARFNEAWATSPDSEATRQATLAPWDFVRTLGRAAGMDELGDAIPFRERVLQAYAAAMAAQPHAAGALAALLEPELARAADEEVVAARDALTFERALLLELTLHGDLSLLAGEPREAPPRVRELAALDVATHLGTLEAIPGRDPSERAQALTLARSQVKALARSSLVKERLLEIFDRHDAHLTWQTRLASFRLLAAAVRVSAPAATSPPTDAALASVFPSGIPVDPASGRHFTLFVTTSGIDVGPPPGAEGSEPAPPIWRLAR